MQTSNGSCSSVHSAMNTSAGSCSSKATMTQASAGSCSSKATMTQASAGSCSSNGAMMQASSGSCSAKGASAGACTTSGACTSTTTAQYQLPKGMQYTKVAVPGGVDYIFTGNGVEKLSNMCNVSCTNTAAQNGLTFSHTEGAGYVVVSVRGNGADTACDSVVHTALMTSGVGEAING